MKLQSPPASRPAHSYLPGCNPIGYKLEKEKRWLKDGGEDEGEENEEEVSGVDASKLHEALGGGFADSIPLQIFGPRFAGRVTEPLLGHVYTMLKDLDAAGSLGSATQSPLPMAATAAELLRRVATGGFAEEDIGNIMKFVGSHDGQD